MGSLENALCLARKVGETVNKVQGPMDVHFMVPHITTKFDEFQKQGPQDMWWEGVRGVYDDCMKSAPQKCITLAEYAQWAEHMVRFWHTILSAREMIVAWAGRDPTSWMTNISPYAELIRVRDFSASSDFSKDKTAKIVEIGDATLAELQKIGIDCFDPWTPAQYRLRLLMAAGTQKAKVIHHQTDFSLLCGFYMYKERPSHPPPSAMPKDRVIGNEVLRTRTLWVRELFLERVGFCPIDGCVGITSIHKDEVVLRIALDLMKISTDTKLPLVLPEARKQTP